MLPPEIKNLAEQAVNNQIPKYHTATREAIQQAIFEHTRKNTLQSSTFDRADCECRIKTFTDFGGNIVNEISALRFDPPPNCEDELVSIATKVMRGTANQEITNFGMGQVGHESRNRGFHVNTISDRCERVIKDVETKIRIHVQSLRHNSQQRTNNTNIIFGDRNVMQAGSENNANRTEVVEKEKPHWTVTPSFWIAVVVLILTAAILYYTVILTHNEKQDKPSTPVTHTNSPST